jgi:hypothetical protein
MELLWASRLRTPDAVPSPVWHGEVLAARLDMVERGESEYLSLAELRGHLQKSPP